MLLESENREKLLRSVLNRTLLVDFHGAGSLQTPVFSSLEKLTTLSESLYPREIAWMT